MKPDLTLLLDLPVETGLKRAAARGKVKDRMEREKTQFHRRVRKVFLRTARMEKRRFIVVDGGKSREEVYRVMLEKLVDRLPAFGPRGRRG